ncbi:MAG: hypothetical protein KA368_09870 [Acidobacteria bacterium]|nr:hypothetical protein [Acidobacteriota bacterium]
MQTGRRIHPEVVRETTNITHHPINSNLTGSPNFILLFIKKIVGDVAARKGILRRKNNDS